MTPPRIDNRRARRLFMRRHALAEPPTGRLTGDGLLALIERLGFVQVDSIRTVERAHHMILFARNQTYRPKALKRLIERDRALFENWTHDASIIPTRFFPYWRTAMAEKAPRIAARWESYGRVGFREQAEEVMAEIARRGPCLSREMGAEETRSNGGWWEWNPSKTALEYLWRSGRLCVARREGFQKVYDLTENVIPEAHHAAEPPDRAALIDWSCGAALDRLGFATTGELAAFWALISPGEAKTWAAGRSNLIEIEVEGADGTSRRHLARPELLAEETPEPPARMRVLSPFDPMIRDRKRARRLFGFDYTIEVFVPAEKRKYGYYVFPLLEGDRLIGRIDMKADRVLDALVVTGLWLEPGVRRAAGRLRRLESELERQRRLAGVGAVRFDNGWIRD
ncbi:winged helix-turn-helix domain-containing protein [Pikeienuella piscinae]|uniref:Winged helix-turn-helix domain-containing protein n=1 Tax=Pikeienuella piscinae TaxID=2748098 RepID=A0A7L5C0H7_9RHOB|nr:crosslink repair DNA glycosylase YcaQ family protein [Pikeienuella piscinae]QIE56257.1 winged helix-turn-helix domain-containing protein [Pikeienuella piscinae]